MTCLAPAPVNTVLASRYPHHRDPHITFDAGPHEYKIHGEGGYISVSTLVKEYFPTFDGRAVAERMVERKDFPHNAKYADYVPLAEKFRARGQLVDAIIHKWDAYGKEQAELGTQLHEYIEEAYNYLALTSVMRPLHRDCPPEYAFVHTFLEDRRAAGYEPYRTEWRLYDRHSKIAGTIDMVLFKPDTSTYHMVDWKRSKKISKHGYGKYGRGICGNIADCNFNHYSLQLNMYTALLHANYGITISSMELVIFHPSNTNYLTFTVPFRQKLVQEMMGERLLDVRLIDIDAPPEDFAITPNAHKRQKT